jgi:hypothetical protein
VIDTALAQLGEWAAQMSTVEWIIAGIVAVLLVMGIVKQAAKLALGAAFLFAVGVFLLHGQSQGWQISF